MSSLKFVPNSLVEGRAPSRPKIRDDTAVVPPDHAREYEHEKLTRYMCSIILSPNALHLISVAPSIKRAKS